MQLVARLIAVGLLVWSMKASALPGEDKYFLQSSREQIKARRGLVLKMLADLIDGVDVGHDMASSLDDPQEDELEERHTESGQHSQRDRKTPCTGFFWKTFTHC